MLTVDIRVDADFDPGGVDVGFGIDADVGVEC